MGGTGSRVGAGEKGEEKKAWVLLEGEGGWFTGGGALRASGETSENEEEREEEGLMTLRWERGDDVDEDVEIDSSGRVVAGDHSASITDSLVSRKVMIRLQRHKYR